MRWRLPWWGAAVASAGLTLGQTPAPLAPATALLAPAASPDSGVGALGGSLAGIATGTVSPFEWGPVELRPSVTYQYLVTTGLLAEPGEPANSAIQTIGLGALFRAGRVWTLDYEPTWVSYSNPLFQNSFDQSLHLQGATTFEAWTFQVGQFYSRTSDVLVSTAAQTPEQDYLTSLSATDALNSQLQVQYQLGQDLRIASTVPGSREWTGSAILRDALGGGWQVSAGPSSGYVRLADPGLEMVYGQFQPGVAWRATPQLQFDVGAGVEIREIGGATGRTIASGIYRGSATFAPVPTSSLSLSFSRDLETSTAIDQLTQASRINLTWQQRFLRHFYFTVGGGFEQDDYLPLQLTVEETRTDRFATVQGSVGTSLFRHFNLSLQYSHAKDTSTVVGYGFSSSQAGVVLQYHF